MSPTRDTPEPVPMTESHPDPRPKGIRAWAHVKHPGVRLFRRIMDGGSHYPSGFTSLGRNIEIGAGIASVFATDEEWRSLNALIDEAEARSSHSDVSADLRAALERIKKRLTAIASADQRKPVGNFIVTINLALEDADEALTASQDRIPCDNCGHTEDEHSEWNGSSWQCPAPCSCLGYIYVEHTQECIDSFYVDGGQTGCICGAEARSQLNDFQQWDLKNLGRGRNGGV